MDDRGYGLADIAEGNKEILKRFDEWWVNYPIQKRNLPLPYSCLNAWMAALQSGWQPIETAPKDGSPILIYCPNSRRPVQEVAWHIPYEGATQGCWQTPWGPTGRGYIILESSPTHWMPLPLPPKESK